MHTVISPTVSDAPGLAAFIDYLHEVREIDRVLLARDLHDEIGTLLVAADMELSWIAAHTVNRELDERLQRVRAYLADATRIGRQCIERLRPTLLETLGLFDTLRWCFRNACHGHPAHCSATLPSQECVMEPDRLTHVFRATEMLLVCTLLEVDLRSIDLQITVVADSLCIALEHRHHAAEPGSVLERFRFELLSVSHRVAVVGGVLTFDAAGDGGRFSIRVPLRNQDSARV